MPEDEPKKNGLLQTIFAGGDTSVKLLTMALIVISGGGNFFATNNLSHEERAERDRATREIHAMHDSLFEAIRRQKNIEDLLDQLNRKLNK